MIVLSNEEIESVLTMDACIDALRELYREIAAGRAVSSPRADIFVPAGSDDRQYAFKSMAGVAPKFGVAALRLNSDVLHWPVLGGRQRRVKIPAAPGNRWVGLVMLFSSVTGEPLAIFPDGVMQRLRVGATNALAAEYLARREACRVGILGSGWQAGAQLMGLCAVRQIERIKVFSPDSEHRRTFAKEMTRSLGVDVQPCETADEAVRHVDILVAATNSVEPVIEPQWLKPGMHAGCVKKQEADERIFRLCDPAVVHHLGQLKQDNYIGRPGQRKIPEIHRGGWWTGVRRRKLDGRPLYELADLVGGKIAGRTDPDQISLFMNNIGTGLQFAAAGSVAYERAKAQGLGREIPTEWFLETVHP